MPADNIHVSVVSPVYQAEKIVDLLVEKIREEVSKITENFEIVLVEDGSGDQSWKKIEENARRDPRVRGVKLSRNFGQHKAITAGLDLVSGEWVVVMDCDLQDRPQEIPRLYAKAMEGYEVVMARRAVRQDSAYKIFLSNTFNRVLSFLTDTKYDSSIANFGIYHHKVIEVLRQMREQTRFFPIMIRWSGFHHTLLDVEHASRKIGKTTYSFKKALNLALSVMLAFSDKPLRLTVQLGFILSSIAIIAGVIMVILSLTGSFQADAWTSVIISLWLLGGIIILLLGVVGLYVGKAFEEVKKRPIYVVQEKTW